MSAIEAIRQAEHAARLTAAANFEKLAEDLARGEPAPADAVAVLQAAGRTADQLAKRVALAAERQRLRPLAAAFSQIQADRAAACEKLKEVEAEAAGEMQRLQAEQWDRIRPLQAEVDRLTQAEQDSRAAKSRLRNLDDSPSSAVTVE